MFSMSHSTGFRLNPAFHQVKIIFGPMVFQLLRENLQEEFLHHSQSNLCATTFSCLRNAFSAKNNTNSKCKWSRLPIFDYLFYDIPKVKGMIK